MQISFHKHLSRLAKERDRRYEQKFLAQEQAVKAALEAAREATSKAEAAGDRTQQLFENQIRGINEKMGEIVSRMDTLAGRGAGMNQGWMYLAGGVALVTGLITILGAILAAAVYVTNNK